MKKLILSIVVLTALTACTKKTFDTAPEPELPQANQTYPTGTIRITYSDAYINHLAGHGINYRNENVAFRHTNLEYNLDGNKALQSGKVGDTFTIWNTHDELQIVYSDMNIWSPTAIVLMDFTGSPVTRTDTYDNYTAFELVDKTAANPHIEAIGRPSKCHRCGGTF